MPTYYAITCRNGRWHYVYAGTDPQLVYQEAAEILQGQSLLPEEDGLPISASAEQQLNLLRVVTADMAREKYHVVFSRVRMDER